jgi:hypothetical protein
MLLAALALILAAAAPDLPVAEFSRATPDLAAGWPAPDKARPYLARPQVEARVPEAMRFSEEDDAYSMYEKTMFRYDLCILGTARHFARRSNEPAATIAEASIGNCSSWKGALISAAFESTKSLKKAELVVREYLSNRRARASAMVIETRSPGARPRRR